MAAVHYTLLCPLPPFKAPIVHQKTLRLAVDSTLMFALTALWNLIEMPAAAQNFRRWKKYTEQTEMHLHTHLPI